MSADRASGATPVAETAALPRTLTAAEVWGFGSAALFLGWLALPEARPISPGFAALAVSAAAIAGAVLLGQLAALVRREPDLAGGTATHALRLLPDHPGLARYGAAASIVSWAALPALGAAVLADLVGSLARDAGVALPDLPLRLSFLMIGLLSGLGGVRSVSIPQVLFAAPAIVVGLLLAGAGLWGNTLTPEFARTPDAWTGTGSDFFRICLLATLCASALDAGSACAAESRSPESSARGLVASAAVALPLLVLIAPFLADVARAGDAGPAPAMIARAVGGFWGSPTPALALFLVAAAAVLAGAAAQYTASRVVWQSSREGHLWPFLGVVSPQGVPVAAMTLTFAVSIGFALAGNPLRILVLAAVARCAGLAVFHLGLWRSRETIPVAPPFGTLALLLWEAMLLAAAFFAFSGVELAAGLALPAAFLGVDALLRRVPADWFPLLLWPGRLLRESPPKVRDTIIPQVCTILAIACGSALLGFWLGGNPGPKAGEVLVLLLLGTGAVSIAATSWTSLADVRRIDQVRAEADHVREALQIQIDERLRAEEYRERSEVALRAVLNSIGDGVVVADRTGRLLFHNPAAERILGGSLGEVRAEHWSETFGFYLPDGVTPMRASDLPIVRALRGESTDGVEVFLRNARLPQGAYVRFTESPLKDEHGELRGGVVVFSDITALKLTEEQLLEKVQLLDLAHDAVIVRTLEGKIRFWNRGAENIYGWTKMEVLHQVSHQILRARYPQPLEVLNAALYRNGFWEGELSHARRDGVRLVIESRWAVKRDRRGRPSAILEINRDVTARKAAAGELALAKEAAEAASRAKSEFVANMSHEVRTPLNGVVGMIELVLRSDLTSRQREYLTLGRSAAKSLLRVVNDVLDFSKIEARKLEMESQPFAVQDAIGQSLRLLAVPAHDKGIEITSRIAPGVPARVIGDPGRLGQVLYNLLNNAVKFTEHGDIDVEVECERNEPGAAVLLFTVRDTGVGIPADKQRMIFEAFTQADTSSTRKYGGTGLGLAISRQLVGMMGGRIEVESSAGAGSVFRFTARFELPVGDPSAAIEVPEVLRNEPVLVADAHPRARSVIAEALGQAGMVVSVAESGPSALEALRRAEALGAPIRLAFLDAGLPEMDGLAVAEALRSGPSPACKVALVLPPVDAAGDALRLRSLAGLPYLRKPVLPQDAVDLAAAALSVKGRGRRAVPILAPCPDAVPFRRLRILLAEDNEINQVLARTLLESRGHRVVVAPNGTRALELLESGSFDLALMDVSMPEMDGFQVTRKWRAREDRSGHRLPIIAMTAHAKKGDRERCLAAGMDDYIMKPVDAEDLFERVERCIELEEEETAETLWARPPGAIAGACTGSGGSEDGPPPAMARAGGLPEGLVRSEAAVCAIPRPTGDSVPPESPNGPSRPDPSTDEGEGAGCDSSPAFDREAALRRARGKLHLLQEMARLFLGQAGGLLESLRDAELREDWHTVGRIAHRLVGSLGNLGAPAAYEAAKSLEELAGQGEGASIQVARTRLEAHVSRLQVALSELRKEDAP